MADTDNNWADWNTATPQDEQAPAEATDAAGPASDPGGWTEWITEAVSAEIAAVAGFADPALAADGSEDDDSQDDDNRDDDFDDAAGYESDSGSDSDHTDPDAWLAVNANAGIDTSAGFDTSPAYDMGAS